MVFRTMAFEIVQACMFQVLVLQLPDADAQKPLLGLFVFGWFGPGYSHMRY
jgi:uncharacterized RDD family membrane protein YckC